MTRELNWLLVCAALATGEGCGFAAADYAALWPIALILTFFAALFGYGFAWRGGPYLVAFLTGVTLAGATAAARRRTLEALLEEQAGRPVTAIFMPGDDVREETSARGRRFITFAGSVEGLPVRVHLEARLADVCPQPGERWACTGWLGRTDDGLFGRRRPFWIAGRGASAARLTAGSDGLVGMLRRWRTTLSRRLGQGLAHAPLAADLNRAMLLGERARIDGDLRETFVAAGTIHVFAISGLHVLILARFLAAVLQLLRVPSRVLALALVPLIWVYVILVGCGPSAVRAATMATFFTIAPLFWRKPDALTAWALAFLLAYGLCPALFFDVGCSFSFAVMLALVLWGRWCRPLATHALGRLGVVAVAWAAGVPIAARVFGRLTPGGLIANLVSVPLAAVSVLSSVLGLVTGVVSQILAAHFNNFAALATDGLVAVSRGIAACPWSSREVQPWSLGACFAWYAALVLVLLVLRRRASSLARCGIIGGND